MAYRPYPNADRALRQLARHEQPAPPIAVTPALRATVEFVGEMQKFARQVVASAGYSVDKYRPSTR